MNETSRIEKMNNYCKDYYFLPEYYWAQMHKKMKIRSHSLHNNA